MGAGARRSRRTVREEAPKSAPRFRFFRVDHLRKCGCLIVGKIKKQRYDSPYWIWHRIHIAEALAWRRPLAHA